MTPEAYRQARRKYLKPLMLGLRLLWVRARDCLEGYDADARNSMADWSPCLSSSSYSLATLATTCQTSSGSPILHATTPTIASRSSSAEQCVFCGGLLR